MTRLDARARAPQAGLSLIEVTVALSLLVIVLMGLVALSALTNQQINEGNDRAVAHAAAQSTIEFLGSRSVDEVLTYHGTTFTVEGVTASRAVGTITTTDLGWDASTARAYLVTAEVRDPDSGRQLAVLSVVRTR
ncbi:MAG: prepilin-type N-terminal cleavage/methylation domain-containing protein [Planctomycetes bacterium]|nr:prepilin-type N-terminal cleavage/methylation domain-containing protein [Planctomycetota bacterium]